MFWNCAVSDDRFSKDGHDTNLRFHEGSEQEILPLRLGDNT